MVWDKLLYYARFNRIDKKHTNFVSLSLDNPAITPEDKCRFYVGIIMNDGVHRAKSYEYYSHYGYGKEGSSNKNSEGKKTNTAHNDKLSSSMSSTLD